MRQGFGVRAAISFLLGTQARRLLCLLAERTAIEEIQNRGSEFEDFFERQFFER